MNKIEKTKFMSLSDWFITYILTAIPILNIIMLFVWAFGSNTQPNKRNWAKAMLIIFAILTLLIIGVIIIFGAFLGGLIMKFLEMSNTNNGL